ncbi:MAG: cytochrome b [Methylococcaceae bacterium]|jgi:cytochrome b561
MDTVNRLSWVTIVLHWLVAIPMIGLISLGLLMVNLELFDYYGLHKSIGVMLAAVILLRVAWRIRQGWPTPVASYPKAQALLAKAVHWSLIISTVLMPLSGMLFSGASGHGFGVFGLSLVSENLDAAKPGAVIPLSKFWSTVGQTVHEYMGYLLILAIIVHIAGVIKHHYFDKDTTLLRMLGRHKML